MTAPSPSRPSAARTRGKRTRLLAQGLRPITLWVPDVASPAFHAEAHRPSLGADAALDAADDQAFIDALSEHPEE